MSKQLADLKNVRPFNFISRLEVDPHFSKWWEQTKELCIEIGCGAGLHPILWAQDHPQEQLVAFERTKTKFSAFKQRLGHHELANIFALNVDAEDWLPLHIKKNSVSRYFFLYPNPYPKEKQANKRWYRSPFLHFVLDSLKEGGVIYFATNQEKMAHEGLCYAQELWGLELVSGRDSKKAKWAPRTHFEKKYLSRNETCFDFIFRKKQK
jgi:tRNA (guanine-N7-)-methyltransferase